MRVTKEIEVVYDVELLRNSCIGKELNADFSRRMRNVVEGNLQLDSQKKSFKKLNYREEKKDLNLKAN
jgi:hypothetical protein